MKIKLTDEDIEIIMNSLSMRGDFRENNNVQNLYHYLGYMMRNSEYL